MCGTELNAFFKSQAAHVDLLLSAEEIQDCVVKSRAVSVEKPGWNPNCLLDKKFLCSYML